MTATALRAKLQTLNSQKIEILEAQLRLRAWPDSATKLLLIQTLDNQIAAIEESKLRSISTLSL